MRRRAQAVAAVGALLIVLSSQPSTAVADPAVATPVVDSITASDGRLDVTWIAGDPSTPTHYVATASPGGMTCETDYSYPGCAITGLTDGVPYTVTVVATVGDVSSDASAPSSPATPVDLTAPQVTDLRVSPTTVPLGGGVITVTARISDAVSGVVGGSPHVQLVDRSGSSPSGDPVSLSLASGDAFDGIYSGTITVPAGVERHVWYVDLLGVMDGAGNRRAPQESDDYIQTGVPAAPTNVEATLDGRTIHVTWDPPSTDNGQPIVGYDVAAEDYDSHEAFHEAAPGDTSVDLLAGDLPPTTLLVSVSAVNASGRSPRAVAPTSVTIVAAPPDSPSASGTSGDGTVAVSWNAPLHTNGARVSSYTVALEPGGQQCIRTTPSTCTFTVPDGIAYTATVTATNAAGVSVATIVPDLRPYAPPTAPSSVTLTRLSTRTMRVSWTPGVADYRAAAGTGFAVTYGSASGPSTTVWLDSSRRSITLANSSIQTDVIPNRPYTASVVTIGEHLDSVPTVAPQRVVLPDIAKLPNTMYRPSVVRIGHASATVRWTGAAAPGATSVSGYLVRIWDGSRLIRATVLRSTARSDREIDLPYGTHYFARVYATNEAGMSHASAATRFRLARR
jgi:hypothetical protein